MFEYYSTTAILLASIFIILYLYVKYHFFSYWKKHNVPHEMPSFPFGNIPFSYFLGHLTIGDFIKASYDKFKSHPFHGVYIFHQPILFVNDPELIKIILIKEFSKFTDRGLFYNEKLDPLTNSLDFQPGEKWKRLRNKFTPTFTPQKLKNFHVLMAAMSNEMIKVMDEELENSDTLEMMNIIRRYLTDVISSVVYGLDTDSLTNAQNEFRKFGMKSSDSGRIILLFAMWLPEILDKITLPLFHTEVKNFFVDIFEEVVEYRRKNYVERNDMLNLLMQLMDEGSIKGEESSLKSDDKDSPNSDGLSMIEAAAQAFLFFVGGIETSSVTVSYCLLEMGLNPHMQEKLQQEIDEAYKSSKGVTFDSFVEMEYLEMVVNETMRKYTAVALLNRMAVEDFSIPGSNFIIPKGMRIVIPNIGIHNNPTYFPDPEKFDPLRYTNDKIASRDPCLELMFGRGPRDCIGKRFGVTQVKQAIITVLRHYTIRVSDKTKFPIKSSTDSFIPYPVNGIHLHFEKRQIN